MGDRCAGGVDGIDTTVSGQIEVFSAWITRLPYKVLTFSCRQYKRVDGLLLQLILLMILVICYYGFLGKKLD